MQGDRDNDAHLLFCAVSGPGRSQSHRRSCCLIESGPRPAWPTRSRHSASSDFALHRAIRFAAGRISRPEAQLLAPAHRPLSAASVCARSRPELRPARGKGALRIYAVPMTERLNCDSWRVSFPRRCKSACRLCSPTHPFRPHVTWLYSPDAIEKRVANSTDRVACADACAGPWRCRRVRLSNPGRNWPLVAGNAKAD